MLPHFFMLKQVSLFTDGSCLGNPGPGGYGAILIYKQHQKELSQGYRLTTNNRMELMAAIAGLQSLQEPCIVQLTTDSQYVKQGITQWIQTGSAAAGSPPARSRSKTSICGNCWMRRCSGTRFIGTGSRGTRVTMRTSAATFWLATPPWGQICKKIAAISPNESQRD